MKRIGIAILTGIAHIHVFPLTVQQYYYKTLTWWEHVKQGYEYYRLRRAVYHADMYEREFTVKGNDNVA